MGVARAGYTADRSKHLSGGDTLQGTCQMRRFSDRLRKPGFLTLPRRAVRILMRTHMRTLMRTRAQRHDR
jgi:hypothetical protein